MKKRFLLSLVAVAMSMAGCKNKNKDPEPQTVTPSTPTDPTDPVDPVDPGEGGGGKDTEGLSPTQQASANEIKAAIQLALVYGLKYDSDDIRSIDRHLTRYAEEIAAEDVALANISDILEKATELNTQDAGAIVDFVVEAKEEGCIKDLTYFGVAFGKSYLRAVEVSDEEYGPVAKYFTDYMDKEGIRLHENLAGFIDAAAGCLSIFTSEEFSEAKESIYIEEPNEISFENLSKVMTLTSGALEAFGEGYDSASYLANLVVDGLVAYAEENLELDEDAEALIESLDVNILVDGIYALVESGAMKLEELAQKGSSAEYAVALINVALAEGCEGVIVKLLTDFIALIGINKKAIDNAQTALGELVGGIEESIQAIGEDLAKDFFNEETGEFSAKELQKAVYDIGETIKGLSELEEQAIILDEFVMLVVHNTLVIVFEYEEEEAAAIAEKFDISEEIEEISAKVEEIGAEILGIDESIFKLIADIINGDVEAIVCDVIDLVGATEAVEAIMAEVDAIMAEVDEIKDAVYPLYEEFMSQVYCDLIPELVDPVSKQVDIEVLKQIIAYSADIWMDILAVQENVLAIVDSAVEIVKIALEEAGMDKEEIEALLEDFDSEEFVGSIFDGIHYVLGYLSTVESLDDDNAYLVAFKLVIWAFADETNTPEEIYSILVDAFCLVVGEYFEIDDERMHSVFNALCTPLMIKEIIDLFKPSESGSSSMINMIFNIDPVTGQKTISELGGQIILAVSTMFAGAFARLAEDWIVTVDVLEEIVGKIDGTYDPEAESDPESIYSEVRAVFAEFRDLLNSYVKYVTSEEVMPIATALIIQYGNLILEGLDIYAEYEETGHFNFSRIEKYIIKVAAIVTGSEIEDFEITSLDEVEDNIAEAIHLEWILEEMEGTEEFSSMGDGFAYHLIENEGEYSLEFVIVTSYEILSTAGEITSIFVVGTVYTFELPGDEYIAQIVELYETAQAAFVVA